MHRIAAGAACRCRRASPGFALLVVLWWLSLMAFLAVRMIATSHTAGIAAANIRGSAVTEAAADGAVNQAIFAVLAGQWAADRAIHLVRSTQAIAEVAIEDEGEKVSLNVAPPALLQSLLQECGLPPGPAAALAAAIAGWRAPELTPAASGALAIQYRSAGRGYIPPGKRFISLDELGLVLGMTPALFTCIAPHVSTYTLSIPSWQTTTDQVVRRALARAYPDDPMHPVSGTAYEPAVIRISASARDTSGTIFRRVAIVRIAPLPSEQDFTYRILLWEREAD